MDYDEAVDLEEVSRANAKREVMKHYADWQEFLQEVGDREVYTGQEILDWLGY